MEKRQQGRIALVTGASKGIGLAVAERLAQEGASVVVCGRDSAAAEAAAEAIAADRWRGGRPCRGRGRRRRALRACSARSRSASASSTSSSTTPASRRASAGARVRSKRCRWSVWSRTIQTNLTGTFLVTRAAVPLLKKAGFGRIVNMASQAGRMYTGFGSVHYSASKAGQIGLSRVLAGELGPLQHHRQLRVALAHRKRHGAELRRRRHDRGAVHRPNAARPHRDAAGRGCDGRVPRLRRSRLHHRDDRRRDGRFLHALSSAET